MKAFRYYCSTFFLMIIHIFGYARSYAHILKVGVQMLTRFSKTLSAILLSLVVVGCSVAPLSTPKSGRSLGHKKWLLEGSVYPAMSATLGYGFTEDFDAGAIMELQFGTVFSLWGKYALVNNFEGVALSLYGGVFSGSGFGDSDGFYGGPVVSYKSRRLEAYLSSKVNYVDWSLDGISKGDADKSIFEDDTLFGDFSFVYVQTDLGINFWMSPKAALNLHVKYFVSLDTDKVDFEDSTLPGAAIFFVF